MKKNFKVPFMDLRITDSIEREALINSFGRLMDHGQYIMGKEVDDFEKNIAKYCNRKYCIGVSSGTDAIYIALKCLGIGPGDEVVTTSLSWIATANAISMTGAKPVFCDIGNDLNISVKSIECMISNKTKAILPVHYTGRACNVNSIDKISKRHGIPVIYDAAQAFGSTYNSDPIGKFGDATCFSMNPMKTLAGLGEAGCVVTDDRSLYESIKILRYNGTINKEICVVPGLNGRIDSLQAAILLDRMKNLSGKIKKIKSICSHYDKALKDVVKIPKFDTKHNISCYYSYTIQAESREDLSSYLFDKGIETKVQHPILMPDQDPYIYNKKDNLVNANRIVNSILCLPANEKVHHDVVEYISTVIHEFYK